MNKKVYLLLFMMMSAVIGKINAQVNYKFQALSGTFTPVASPTFITFGQLTTGAAASPAFDDGFKNNIPIPFSFNYNGASYTKCHVCTNGFIGFGTGFKAVNAPTTATATYCSSHDMAGAFTGDTAARPVRPLLAPFWGDLAFKISTGTPTTTYASNATQGVMYATTGTTPNRVFTMEFRNALWNWGAATGCMSFQIKLYETTNVIEYVYKQLTGAISNSGLTDAPTAGIGITAVGRGSLNYISLTDSTSNPTANRIGETDITGRPATGQIYRWTPYPSSYPDIAVANVYTPATVAISPTGDAQKIGTFLANYGNTTETNVPVILNITGANTFSDTFTIASLAPGKSGYLTFAKTFTPTNTGTNNISISIPSDSISTNNAATMTQAATTNTIDYTTSAPTAGGLGVTGGGLTWEMASLISNSNPHNVNGIILNFRTGGQPFNISVYDNTGTNGAPGAQLWTSTTATTSTAGQMIVPISPSIAVTTDYYVAVSQNDTINFDYAYEKEFPVGSGRFFFSSASSGGFFDAANTTGRYFRLKMGATHDVIAPVKLVKFSGNKTSNGNILKWTTANETNNKGFEILRSSDAKNYDKIAFVNSLGNNGNSNAELNYVFTDNNAKGTNYYRLKQIDKDGKITLSEIVVIKGIAEAASIYPNPVASKLNIHYTSAINEKATVVVVDAMGKIAATFNTNLTEGTSTYSFDVNALKAGTYFVKMNTSNGLEIVKFEKQ